MSSGTAQVLFARPGLRRRLRIRVSGLATIARFLRDARGVTPRDCSVCGKHGRFAAYGQPPRLDAMCKSCGALERHRLITLHLKRSGFLHPSHSLLHFAPEPMLRAILQGSVAKYDTADLRAGHGITHAVNIEATGLPAHSYDRIICNHVLEHVDDAKALAEMLRLLRPGGQVLLTTPVIEGWPETYENAAITAPQDRVLHFGQHDHVRYFGRDLRDRIHAAGFHVAEVIASAPDILKYGLERGETLFIATRPEEVT